MFRCLSQRMSMLSFFSALGMLNYIIGASKNDQVYRPEPFKLKTSIIFWNSPQFPPRVRVSSVLTNKSNLHIAVLTKMRKGAQVWIFIFNFLIAECVINVSLPIYLLTTMSPLSFLPTLLTRIEAFGENQFVPPFPGALKRANMFLAKTKRNINEI